MLTISAQLVLPNSTVVNVTYESEPDLYYALRGGVNNFGIVTYFTVRVVPQGPQLFGPTTYSLDYTERVLHEAYRLTTELSNDTDMSFWTRYQYNQTTDAYVLSLTQTYLQPEPEPAVFNTVNAIPYESRNISIDWFSNQIDEGVPFGQRYVGPLQPPKGYNVSYQHHPVISLPHSPTRPPKPSMPASCPFFPTRLPP